MKNIIPLLLVVLLFSSCTEEITIDELQNITPRLVIEANIEIDKNNLAAAKTQSIKLSKTSSFYNKDYPPVLGASIRITDQNGVRMGTFLDVNPNLPDDVEDGIYTAVDFITPTLGNTYFMNILVEGTTYSAEDTYTGIVDINEITQEPISFGEEGIRININIDNEIGVENYYLLKTENPSYSVPEISSGDDRFLSEIAGENDFDIFYLYEEPSVETGVENTEGITLNFTLFGISRRYNNYITKVIALSGVGNGGPFSTAPSAVRGNVVNRTNEDEYALGYFSINQFVRAAYELE